MDRLLALPFAALATFVGLGFVRSLSDREFHSGQLLIAGILATVAVGIALRQRWGRTLGLLLMLANAGLMVIGIFVNGPGVGRVVALAVVIALIVALSRLRQRTTPQ